jgi:hypothetical protein
VILETPEVNELGRTRARPTVVRSMGEHERCKGNCPCDGHLQSPRLRRYGSRRPRNNLTSEPEATGRRAVDSHKRGAD